jgi:hypothetical protein
MVYTADNFRKQIYVQNIVQLFVEGLNRYVTSKGGIAVRMMHYLFLAPSCSYWWG